MLRNVFSFELSSGAGSVTAWGRANVSVDAVEAAADRGGDGFLIEEPEEDEAMVEAGVSYAGVRVHRCRDSC